MAYLKRGKDKFYYKMLSSINNTAEHTIVLIHGRGLDSNSWNLLLPFLLKKYHVLFYDLRGHGKSDAGEIKRNISLLTEDLTFLLNKLEIKSYHVVAHGFGGFIGLKFASNYNTELKSLILLAAPLHFPKQLDDRIVEQRKLIVGKEQSMHSVGKELLDVFCYTVTEEKAQIILNAYNKISPTVYFDLFQNNMGQTAAKNINEINSPILLISGSEDEIYPPVLSNASLNFNPNAKHFTIPKASFMLQLDQPKQTVEIINQFIEESQSKFNSKTNEYRKELTALMYEEIRELLEAKDLVNRLDITILNGFSVTLNGKIVHGSWGKRKAKQLLIYLAVRKSATREELCDNFWPESDIKNAKNNLRVALYHLKQILNAQKIKESPSIVGADKELIFLNCNLQFDLADYIEKIKEAHLHQDSFIKANAYKQILNSLSENPLPGLFDEWFLNLRDILEEEWIKMLRFLINFYNEHEHHSDREYYRNLGVHYNLLEESELVENVKDD